MEAELQKLLTITFKSYSHAIACNHLIHITDLAIAISTLVDAITQVQFAESQLKEENWRESL